MKYRLVVYKEKNDLVEIIGYSKTERFKNLDETSLKDIVAFTSCFNDENELKDYLLLTNLLPLNYTSNDLGIAYYANKDSEPKILEYGISYNSDTKFYDIDYLKNLYSAKLTDKKFMDAFIKKYFYSLRKINHFSESLHMIKSNFDFYCKNNYLPEAADYYMKEFIYDYLYKKNTKGQYVISFSRLRELAMFICDFEKENEEIAKEKEEIENLLLVLENYKAILDGGNINDEERDTYDSVIENIELELLNLNNSTVRRRIKNETTSN